MSSGPENRFIQSLHRFLPAGVYRMKNHNPYLAGVPDCWYSGLAGDLWVEYKFLVPPKKATTPVDPCGGRDPRITPLQQEWLIARHSEGRSVGVIIGCPSGGLWLPGVSWKNTFYAADFFAAHSKQQLALTIARIVSPP